VKPLVEHIRQSWPCAALESAPFNKKRLNHANFLNNRNRIDPENLLTKGPWITPHNPNSFGDFLVHIERNGGHNSNMLKLFDNNREIEIASRNQKKSPANSKRLRTIREFLPKKPTVASDLTELKLSNIPKDEKTPKAQLAIAPILSVRPSDSLTIGRATSSTNETSSTLNICPPIIRWDDKSFFASYP
jgi:hypothetical protein